MLAASSDLRNVMVWRPSVRQAVHLCCHCILCVNHGTACKVTICPGFSGTVPIFNDVSLKNHSSLWTPICPVLALCPGFVPICPSLQLYAYAIVAKS